MAVYQLRNNNNVNNNNNGNDTILKISWYDYKNSG